jgi:hypothetical protein
MAARRVSAKSRFNPSNEHGQVFGMPGVKWTQNGAYYAADGTPVNVPSVDPGPQVKLDDLGPEVENIPTLNLPQVPEPIVLVPYAEMIPPPAVPAPQAAHSRSRSAVIELEPKPPSQESSTDAYNRRAAARQTIAQNRHATLVKADALRPYYSPERWQLVMEISNCKSYEIDSLLLRWAELRYEGASIPNREVLLRDFRDEYGQLRHINAVTMRKVRDELASKQQKDGGRPTHKHR